MTTYDTPTSNSTFGGCSSLLSSHEYSHASMDVIHVDESELVESTNRGNSKQDKDIIQLHLSKYYSAKSQSSSQQSQASSPSTSSHLVLVSPADKSATTGPLKDELLMVHKSLYDHYRGSSVSNPTKVADGFSTGSFHIDSDIFSDNRVVSEDEKDAKANESMLEPHTLPVQTKPIFVQPRPYVEPLFTETAFPLTGESASVPNSKEPSELQAPQTPVANKLTLHFSLTSPNIRPSLSPQSPNQVLNALFGDVDSSLPAKVDEPDAIETQVPVNKENVLALSTMSPARSATPCEYKEEASVPATIDTFAPTQLFFSEPISASPEKRQKLQDHQNVRTNIDSNHINISMSSATTIVQTSPDKPLVEMRKSILSSTVIHKSPSKDYISWRLDGLLKIDNLGNKHYQQLSFHDMTLVPNDCVQLMAENSRPPFIVRILQVWETLKRDCEINVEYFYRPEELPHGRSSEHGPNELFSSLFSSVNPIDSIIRKCSVAILSMPTVVGDLPPNDGTQYYCRYAFLPANPKAGQEYSPSPGQNILRLICRPTKFFPVEHSYLMTDLIIKVGNPTDSAIIQDADLNRLLFNPSLGTNKLDARTSLPVPPKQPIKRKLTEELARMSNAKVSKVQPSPPILSLASAFQNSSSNLGIAHQSSNQSPTISIANNRSNSIAAAATEVPENRILVTTHISSIPRLSPQPAIPAETLPILVSNNSPLPTPKSNFLDALKPDPLLPNMAKGARKRLKKNNAPHEENIYYPVLAKNSTVDHSPSIFDNNDGFPFSTPPPPSTARPSTERYLVSAPTVTTPLVPESGFHPGLFSNFAFLLTGFSRRGDKSIFRNAVRISTLISSNGGVQIEEFSTIPNFLSKSNESSNKSPQYLITLSAINDGKPLRTVKHMFSLARGLPPISPSWIDASVRAGKIVSPVQHVLPCGLSINEELIYYQPKRSLSSREGIKPLPMKERVLNGLVAMVTGPKAAEDEWKLVIREAGGSVYEESLALDPTAQSQFAPLECHILLVIPQKDFEPSTLLLARARYHRVHVLTLEWLIQSLICQTPQLYKPPYLIPI